MSLYTQADDLTELSLLAQFLWALLARGEQLGEYFN